MRFELHEVLQEAGEPVRRLYFLESGLASLVTAFEDGSEVEAASIGHEGTVTPMAAQDVDGAAGRVVIQIRGEGFAVSSTVFRELSGAMPFLWRAVVFHTACVMQQAFVSAACNAIHPIRER